MQLLDLYCSGLSGWQAIVCENCLLKNVNWECWGLHGQINATTWGGGGGGGGGYGVYYSCICTLHWHLS